MHLFGRTAKILTVKIQTAPLNAKSPYKITRLQNFLLFLPLPL